MLTQEEARAAMLKKLKDSALTAEDAKRARFKVCTNGDIPAGLTAHPSAGFTLPYHDVQGKPTGFYRYRYLEQPPRRGVEALTKKKEYRYIQPTGVSTQVYFSRLLEGGWEKFFKVEPRERWLIITEGELKADCACKQGFPTLALGGVWTFMSKREGLLLIPDLNELNLKDSLVYIIYDSDASSNPDVLMAENVLARQLLNRSKALPMVIRLPALKGLPKTGLDDYLVQKGDKELQKLIESAEEWEPSAALHQMNEEFIVLREGAAILEPKTRDRWRAAEFVNVVCAHRTYTAMETKIVNKKKEQVMSEKRTAAEWIKWPGRVELERMTYAPGAGRVVDGCYNAWQGWGIAEEHIKRGDVKPWQELLDFLFKGAKKEHRKWFEQWLAFPLQNPGVKMFQGVVMWGGPGTGKTLVGHTLERIYGSNYTEVTERELHGNFNGWAECKQFALGDEITGGDKRAVAEYLKGIITQKFIRINTKFVREYTVPDCLNWYFTSNHPDAFFIEDKDRRYFVNEVRGLPKDRAFYRRYDAWYRSTEGAGALFHHLLHLDLAGFDPMEHAPQTDSKLEMIADGRSDVGNWCAMLRENPDEVLRDNSEGVLPGQSKPILRKLWTSRELYALFDPSGKGRVTQNGLGRELKRAGFRKALGGSPIGTKYGMVKLWVIRAVGNVQNHSGFKKLYEQELEYKRS